MRGGCDQSRTLESVNATAQKMKFSMKDFFMESHEGFLHGKETADLITFAVEIFNGKLHILCSVHDSKESSWPLFPLHK